MWYFIPQFCGFLIFMVASFAETNRAPFDLVEADAELVGGYFTEYGGTAFVAYLFAEYVNMIVVSAMAATLFLGGWLLPFGIHPPGWVDPFVVLAKMMLFITLFIWIRATLPRLRYDQLMSFGWKVLLPLATLNLLVTAIIVVACTVSHAYDPGSDVIEVIRQPQRSAGCRHVSHLRRDAARHEDDARARRRGAADDPVPGGEDAGLSRASAAATSCTGSRTRDSRSASAARCAPPPARPTASAWSPPRTRRRTASRPASATPPCTRST